MFNPGVGGEIQKAMQSGAAGWRAHVSRWEGPIRKRKIDYKSTLTWTLGVRKSQTKKFGFCPTFSFIH